MSATIQAQRTTLYEPAPAPTQDTVSEAFMLADLARSGLVPSDLQAYAITNVFGVGQYIIPYQVPQMWVRRADTPIDKYKGPKGQTDLYIPPTQYPRDKTLWLIEGEKKSAKFSKHFAMFSAGLRGCRGFTQGSVLHPTLVSLLHGVSQVNVVFDGDIETNVQIQYAATTFASLLKALSIPLAIYKPPFAKGVDDWLVEDPNGTIADLVPIAAESLQASRKQVLAEAKVIVNEEGKFERNEFNALQIIKCLYSKRLYEDKRLGVIFDGALCTSVDKVKFDILVNLQEHIDAKFSRPVVQTAVQGYLGSCSTDLVRDTARNVVWDKVSRLDTWGPDYLKVAPQDKHICEEFGRMLMTAFALRIARPGIKADFAFMLVGPQGIRKTTFLEALATFEGHKLYHAIEALPTGTSTQQRHSMVKCARSVIVDMAEGIILDSRGASHENIKQYISQTEDVMQVLYQTDPKVEPRGYIICGATNRSDITSDKSGSRRFIAITVEWCTAIPYDIKLQLIAEALETAVLDEADEAVWWRSRITMDDVDQELRAENPHIDNPQELLNLKFAKHDEFTNTIMQMIEGEIFPKTKAEGHQFITAKFIADKMNENSREITTVNLVARVLRSLCTAPTFAYAMQSARKRLSQLKLNEWQAMSMSNGISNNDTALPGYIVSLKIPRQITATVVENK